MTTVTATDAKLKVRIDLSGSAAELKALEDRLAQIKAALKDESGHARGQSKADEERDQRAGEAAAGKVRFNPLNPLDTALSAIGAIPALGPTMEKTLRVGMDIAENGLPLAEGFAKAALRSMGKGGEGSKTEAFLEGMLKNMQELTAGVAELRAKNDAIAPAYEAMKKLVFAQVMAGGTPDGKDVGSFGETMYKIIYARSAVERKNKRFALEAMGEAGERLFERLFQ